MGFPPLGPLGRVPLKLVGGDPGDALAAEVDSTGPRDRPCEPHPRPGAIRAVMADALGGGEALWLDSCGCS
jgi:hypothetical protein